MKIDVNVGEELFRFNTFEEWVGRASKWFGNLSRSTQYACVDGKGRICQTGKQFMRARDEGWFPVYVYSID